MKTINLNTGWKFEDVSLIQTGMIEVADEIADMLFLDDTNLTKREILDNDILIGLDGTMTTIGEHYGSVT